jgi:hypothetical protein
MNNNNHGGKRVGAGNKPIASILIRKSMKVTMNPSVVRWLQEQDEYPGRLIEVAMADYYGIELVGDDGLLSYGQRPKPMLE